MIINHRAFAVGAFLLAAFHNSAAANATDQHNIRQVQTTSTDVFEVLTTLKTAKSALASRDYITAKRGFKTVLFHDSTMEDARVGLRRSLMALGEMTEAAKLLDNTISPDSVLIQVRLGVVKNPNQRILELLKSESDPRLWTLLGQLQDKSGQFETARQSYAMAGIAGARPGLAANNIGQSHWMAGEYDLALDAFERAISGDPSDTQFDNNRRRSLIRLGRTHEAILGLSSARAGMFLAQAGDQAIADDEIKLARYLYKKSLDLSPRHSPQTAAKLALLEN